MSECKCCVDCKYKEDQMDACWDTSYHCSYGKPMSKVDPVYGVQEQKYSWLSCWVLRSKLFKKLFNSCGPEGQYFVKKEEEWK